MLKMHVYARGRGYIHAPRARAGACMPAKRRLKYIFLVTYTVTDDQAGGQSGGQSGVKYQCRAAAQAAPLSASPEPAANVKAL